MKKIFIILLLTLYTITGIFTQEEIGERFYDFGIYNNYDLRNSSTNAISLHKVLNDTFESLISSKLDSPFNSITKGLFAFSSTYLTMLWSHEFGHSIRAAQIGGSFNIHNINLPIPYTTVDLPGNTTLTNQAIFVTAGFEVNYLNVKTLQSQFVRFNGATNPDLALSFANRLMFPIYTSLVVPIDPSDKNVWINTAGDPVHFILPVFKNFSNDMVFMDDGSVNPELVSFYNETMVLAIAFNLLDPLFYSEVGAAFGSDSVNRTPFFLVGDYDNGWTFGTHFNASPLGYELYMNNYLHLFGKQFNLYLKYGRPFKNIGLGLTLNDALNFKNFSSDIKIECWDQDIYGFGVAGEVNGHFKINDSIGINFTAGYKSSGYLIGKQLESGFNLGGGVTIYK